MRCCQPPAATLRVFEANCCCFYFCCAFLPSFLYCTAPHYTPVFCAALYLPCQHFQNLIASARKESANMEGRGRWGLPAEYLRFNQCLTLQSGRLNGIPISVPP
ncbi:hypothetical protein FOQG_03779 [Fusarium oxysporum f. sp. raphani 54005]|uniref:Uncharacterized protein n=3 Tax=Fusarium oxysporum TaxID=5507 RepID=X0CLJ9_FUSOX|nr:hypothetical protein FOVG_10583 [Fusarium oxysporum f. sp. pisi HDV247]EXK95063.1 hypothetical protein FOQG_03779 [Fusarium oxysporum f. sp. raphani 54005]EXL86605.1 hypothetical protein FOPG_02121 [Fusarium oxysporum f. sp. conglutinans race 2 54008]EXA38770.1 hypothetical protein FOVG_10583 [Fusarium oxysporum f. sp. pisi HDV247]EXA38771.1 hypothetical protein FOVG_10583 [Fusarium oxysporum f. sp. pisi HDV247]